MGDEEEAGVGLVVEAVDALGDDAQGVDVQAGVGLVQDGEAGTEQLHLEDLEALLLTAGEAGVDVALGEGGVHPQVLHGLVDLADPLAHLGGLAVDGGLGRAQEVGHGDAGDLDGVLHGQEEAGPGSLVHAHLQQVDAVEEDLAVGDLIVGVTGDGVGQGGLARAVGAHDGVDLVGVDGQVDALEDGLGAVIGGHLDVKVLDLQSAHATFLSAGNGSGDE